MNDIKSNWDSYSINLQLNPIVADCPLSPSLPYIGPNGYYPNINSWASFCRGGGPFNLAFTGITIDVSAGGLEVLSAFNGGPGGITLGDFIFP